MARERKKKNHYYYLDVKDNTIPLLLYYIYYVNEVKKETKHLNAWSSTSWNFIKINRNK